MSKSSCQFAFSILLVFFAGHSYAWLGERSSDRALLNDSEFERSTGVDSELEEESKLPPYTPWIASEELLEQQKSYREKIKARWPNAQDSLRGGSFTYYPDDFKSSVSVVFSRNQIEIIVPRVKKTKNQAGHGARRYRPQEARARVGQHLRDLLGMKQGDITAILSAELMIDPAILNDESKNSLLFSELYSKDTPTEQDIRRLAFRILKTARVKIKGQLARSSGSSASDRVTFVMNMPDDRVEAAAKQYKDMVTGLSNTYEVPPSLVLAVMHTESFFNPLARSGVPAFGLMQIVPSTGGADAANLIFKGDAPELTPEYLFDERNNLELGAAYLHILYYRYLSGIENERSRAYVAIASYNAGASNVARAFIGVPRMTEAVPSINAMAPREVLERLRNFAPSNETREYLAKVIARERYYQKMMPYW